MEILQTCGIGAGIVFACADGFKDAILYGRKGDQSFTWNEHIVYITARGSFLLALLLPGNWITVLCSALMFSFFHNGFYYTQRDRIDGSYPKRWWAMTKGSSAKINMTPVIRTALAAVGLLGFIATQFIF